MRKRSKLIKSRLRNVIIVAGGPHLNFYPHETIALKSVDYCMVGESEHSFPELVRCIGAGYLSDLVVIDNLITKTTERGSPIVSGRVTDIDMLPFPSRALLNINKYNSIIAKGNPITTVITSRGCPFKCHFCSNIESGKAVRYRSCNNVVDELELLTKKHSIRDFLFFDELFTSNKKRTIDICDEIIRRKLNIRWHCRSRADVLDKEMVLKMKQAGCRLIQFGIETGNERIQKVINKNLDLEKVRNTISMVYDAGIFTFGDFIFGLPTETPEESLNTLEYAKSLKLDYVVFGMFHPIPGSIFYEQGLKEGRFKDFWREYVLDRKNVVKDHSWTGKDREKFHALIAAAYKQFYLRPSYIVRKLTRIDSFSQLIWQAKAAVTVFTNLFMKRFT